MKHLDEEKILDIALMFYCLGEGGYMANLLNAIKREQAKEIIENYLIRCKEKQVIEEEEEEDLIECFRCNARELASEMKTITVGDEFYSICQHCE